MSKYLNTINRKGNEYEIYNTNNILIKYLANRFINKIKQILLQIEAKKLNGIDIGCGEGHMLNILKINNIIDSIVGVDLDRERIIFAKKKYPDINFLVKDIYNIKIKNNKFDYVIAIEILEHLPKPELALKIMRELVGNDGYIIISVPHEPYFQLGNILRGKHFKTFGKTPAHLNFWNKTKFERLLTNNGVKIIDNFNFSTFPWLLYLGKFKK